MKSHEMMKEVLNKTSIRLVAEKLNVSPRTIYSWAEPARSGSPSPLERVVELCRATGDHTPAGWICTQVGGFFIANPRTAPIDRPLHPTTNNIVHEFADMLAQIAVASDDSVITPAEAQAIRARWEALKSVTEGFVTAAEIGNYATAHHPGPATHDRQ